MLHCAGRTIHVQGPARSTGLGFKRQPRRTYPLIVPVELLSCQTLFVIRCLLFFCSR